MPGTRSFQVSESAGLDNCSCTSRCWNPVLMFVLSFILGVGCFFFMSYGGLILGSMHCTLGCILALTPFALYKIQTRFWAILSIMSIVVLVLLVVGSFCYIVWLLVQSTRAKSEMNSDDGSPHIIPLLKKYTQKAGSETERRLEEPIWSMELDGAPLFDEASMDYQGNTGSQALAVLTGAGAEAPTATTGNSTNSRLPREARNLFERPTTSSEQVRKNEKDEDSGTATRQAEAKHLSKSLPLTGFETGTAPAAGEVMKDLVDIAKKKAENILAEGEAPFYPAVLLQSWESTEHIYVSRADIECLHKTRNEGGVTLASERQFRALLDWGLFCGYTLYSFGSLRKWPVSCSDDCHFGDLHFSRHRNDEKKTEEQAKDFLEDLDEMTPAQVEACSLLAIVTFCRIREDHIDSAVITALCIAIVVSVALFCAAIKSFSDCVAFIKEDSSPPMSGRVAPSPVGRAAS